MEARDGPARCWSSTSACPATSTPASVEVFGVTLLDIDDLRAFGEQSLAQRRQEIGKVREIIAEELDRYRIERTAREVAPLVTALRAHAEDAPRRRARTLPGQARRARSRGAGRGRSSSPGASSTSCCTSRPSASRTPPGRARGELYADALVELFGLPSPSPRPTPSARPLMPRPLRVATRGSELARWQADRVATLLGDDVELRDRDHHRRRRAPTSHPRDGRHRRVREGGPAGGARRAAPTSRCTRPRICPRRRRPTASCSRPCPSGPTRATRSSARRSTRSPAGARSAPDRCGGGRSSPRCGPTSRSPSCGATSPTRLEKRRATSTPSWSPPPRSTGSGSPTASTECLDPSVMLPQVGQGALAVECRADDDEARDATRRDRRPRRARAPSTPSAPSSPQLGGGCDLPVRRRSRDGRRRRGVASTRCWRRSTVTSCCGPRVARRRPAAPSGTRRPPTDSAATRGGATSLDAGVGGMTVYLVGRRARRSRSPHRARRRAAARGPTSSSTTGWRSPALLDARARRAPS